MSDLSRIESIFLGALEKGDPAECAAYLDRACEGEGETRRQVERLLQAHPRAARYLEVPGADATRTVDLAPAPGLAGTVIGGRYKLLEPIGEGGMGSVWMAQQTEPVRRTVALKLIKAGMDTKAVLTRFEAERQALALMDHPNIAKVLDAGASDEGRPYFVMELVKGVPITRYCDERKLNLRQRLDLFIPVCQAVQHAHQKGVIHRDLKPSNVLVARYDDRPVPKVIDFGIAKAAGQPLTDRTLVTGFGAVVGTPEYMSPEQAQFNQLDVDTRSDIYALGVMLYELLTGSTPVTRIELEKAGLLEVLRMIRETEPPRPSTRLSTSDRLPSIAAERDTEPKLLPGLLRNDLDWIVMRALEKDRNRRYETATGFAADIRRYLDGEAVQAHPPSTTYRMRKFYRKHRAAILTAAAFVGGVIGMFGAGIYHGIELRRARDEADVRTKEAKDTALLNLQLAERLTEETLKSRQTAARLQFELDQAELKNDPRVGLLRKARSLRTTPGPLHRVIPKGHPLTTYETDPGRKALDQFATFVILAEGQKFAPLLPPISNGGEMLDFHIESKGRRVLMLEEDLTARLWDPSTARLVAVLQRGDSTVNEAGFSPDGLTAFTHTLDGIVRLWDAETGAFRAETEPRPGRLKLVPANPANAVPLYYRFNSRPDVTRISNDRFLTLSASTRVALDPEGGRHYDVPSITGPVELWDASSGKWIARLEVPSSGNTTFRFTTDGRWIVVVAGGAVHVWSAADGKAVARLPLDGDSSLSDVRPLLSPSGRTMATLFRVRKGSGDVHVFVHLWDTSSWKRLSVTGPFTNTILDPDIFSLVDDDRILKSYGTNRLYRAGSLTPIAEFPGALSRVAGDRAWFEPDIVVDTSTWQRLRPPTGRKYHPDLVRFAGDGRFLPHTGAFEDDFSIDTLTEMTLKPPPGFGTWYFRQGIGWFIGWTTNAWPVPLRLPPPDHLNIPPDVLELWLQVAVRGALDDEGTFVKWDAPTWEQRRQELAAKPAPYADFPFPGRVAQDRSHWLRQEYEVTGEPPQLARQLLERAEAIGDQAEAQHWRRILAKLADSKVAPPAK